MITIITPINVSFLSPGQNPDTCGQNGCSGLGREEKRFAGLSLGWQPHMQGRTRNGAFHVAVCLQCDSCSVLCRDFRGPSDETFAIHAPPPASENIEIKH